MIKNITKNEDICKNVLIANNFFKRLKGLMFTKELSSDTSMYINRCNQIHTFFMNYDIDVLYLDKNSIIIEINENVKPGKIGKRIKDAVAVVELPGGKASKANLKVGQAVIIY
ncbi:DUF192 domain-containing protein [Candidatus Clostridium radicumherbarum]|jgi:Uncharacterized conserved protein|uniref:DUF192 domain-containing protein n=1 Tax=Candidatus Clostridium radicumherbarum TaxID=3381662 RepID=A0ABW8TQX0_9CLOT